MCPAPGGGRRMDGCHEPRDGTAQLAGTKEEASGRWEGGVTLRQWGGGVRGGGGLSPVTVAVSDTNTPASSGPGIAGGRADPSVCSPQPPIQGVPMHGSALRSCPSSGLFGNEEDLKD